MFNILDEYTPFLYVILKYKNLEITTLNRRFSVGKLNLELGSGSQARLRDEMKSLSLRIQLTRPDIPA